jgi:hypothetical protein
MQFRHTDRIQEKDFLKSTEGRHCAIAQPGGHMMPKERCQKPIRGILDCIPLRSKANPCFPSHGITVFERPPAGHIGGPSRHQPRRRPRQRAPPGSRLQSRGASGSPAPRRLTHERQGTEDLHFGTDRMPISATQNRTRPRWSQSSCRWGYLSPSQCIQKRRAAVQTWDPVGGINGEVPQPPPPVFACRRNVSGALAPHLNPTDRGAASYTEP